MTKFPLLSNEKKNRVQISATSCGDDLLNQKDATATGLESIPSTLIHTNVSPFVPTPLSARALVPVPISVSVLDATAITDGDINRDKSNSTNAHSTGEIQCNLEGEIPCNSEGEMPCNSEGEIPCNSEGTISLVESMFR